MIQAITFDLWNTIFTNKFYSDLRFKYLTQLLDGKGIPYSLELLKSMFKSVFSLQRRNYDENNHIYTEDRINRLLNLLKIDITDTYKGLIKKEFEEAMLKDPPPLKIGVKEALEELSLDYKIGLISNTGITPGRVISRVLHQYEIFKFFKVKIYSDEIGYYKPHSILFRTALRELECFPQDAIHIGDKLETDIKGAKDYNMLTIWLNDSKSPSSEFIQPDYEIYEISEAIQIIKRLN